MKEKKHTLLASSANIQSIKKQIAAFFCNKSENITPKPISEDSFSVFIKEREMQGVRVTKQKTRYRFEMG